jgi:hypothetical protein
MVYYAKLNAIKSVFSICFHIFPMPTERMCYSMLLCCNVRVYYAKLGAISVLSICFHIFLMLIQHMCCAKMLCFYIMVAYAL